MKPNESAETGFRLPGWRYGVIGRFLHHSRRFAHRPLSQTALVTGITVGLIISGFSILGGGVITAPVPLPPHGWLTFTEARDAAEPVVRDLPGGPWSVSLAEGVAATGGWSPNLSMWTLNYSNLSMVFACQASLRGPSLFTFWNGSLFPGASGAAAFDSGGAGLWTFVFQADGGRIAMVSILNNTVYLNGVLPAHSACSSLGGPFDPVTSYLDVTNITDTSTFARATFDDLTSKVDLSATDTAAYYILGNPAVPISYKAFGYNQEWSAYYGTCGLPGVAGEVSYFGAPQNLPNLPGATIEVTFGASCFSSLAFLSPRAQYSWSANGTYYAEWPLSLTLAGSGSATAPPRGLTTSLFSMDALLNSSEGPFSVLFPTGTPLCQPFTRSVIDCPHSSTGWYAVLMGSNGTLVDTFPSSPGATSWTLPNVPVQGNDTLVLISEVPLFQILNSGLRFISGYAPFVCCGIPFGAPR